MLGDQLSGVWMSLVIDTQNAVAVYKSHFTVFARQWSVRHTTGARIIGPGSCRIPELAAYHPNIDVAANDETFLSDRMYLDTFRVPARHQPCQPRSGSSIGVLP